MKLYYGTGKIILDSRLTHSEVIIYYRGNPYLKVNKDIEVNKGDSLFTFKGKAINGEFVAYFGYLKILGCRVDGLGITIKPLNIHISELMDVKSEDIAINSENLKNSYVHYKVFRGNQFPKNKKRTFNPIKGGSYGISES